MKFLMIFISLFIFLNGKVIDSLAILVNEQPITTYDIEKLQKQVGEKLGYKLVDHRLELYGSKIKK